MGKFYVKVVALCVGTLPTCVMAQSADICASRVMSEGVQAEVYASGQMLVSNPLQNRRGISSLPDDEYLVAQENWTVICKNDAMTDVRECQIRSGIQTTLAFALNGKPEVGAICLMGSIYPGTEVQIRVGEATLFSISRGSCFVEPKTVRSIMSNMKLGVQLRTRQTRWPENKYLDKDYTVSPVLLATFDAAKCLFEAKAR